MARQIQAHTPWFKRTDDEPDDEDAAQRLNSLVARLENAQADRKTHLLKLYSIYHNIDLRGMSVWSNPLGRPKPVSILNMSKVQIDGLVAKFVANESKATFDVSDGDWVGQGRAKDLDKFQFGEVYRLNLNETCEEGMRDAVIGGDGWVKFYERNNKVAAERTFPLEMLLDTSACVSGPPRELYQVRYLDRSQAMALYNEYADEIAKLPGNEPKYPVPGSSRDVIRLTEAWHLPDDDDGTGGKYMFTCGDVIIEACDYTRSEFPFVRFTWTKDMLGGYSVGLQQDLLPLQIELDKLMRRQLQGLYVHGLPKFMQASGGKMKPEDVSNDLMQKYEYIGPKPEVVQAQCFAPELAKEIENIISRFSIIAGYSAMQAGSDMPSRMDSRPGLREYAALTDEKHAMPSKSWERGILGCARQIIAIARQIEEGGVEYETMGAAKDFTKRIKFKDCDLEDHRFTMKLQNTNLLPTTPAGKILRLQDLAQTPAFQDDPSLVWKLLGGAPDVDAIIGDKTVGENLIQKQIATMISERKYFGPDKHQNAQMALTAANNAIQKLLLQTVGERDKDSNEVYNLLDRYCQACHTILTGAAAAPAAMAPPPPGAMPDAAAGQSGPTAAGNPAIPGPATGLPLAG